jgi:hypothetical protein
MSRERVHFSDWQRKLLGMSDNLGISVEAML